MDSECNADYWKDKSKFVGDVGRIYGVQWRNFNGVDQINNLIDGLKKNQIVEDIYLLLGIQQNLMKCLCLPVMHFHNFLSQTKN